MGKPIDITVVSDILLMVAQAALGTVISDAECEHGGFLEKMSQLSQKDE
jgi:hypothetical protein